MTNFPKSNGIDFVLFWKRWWKHCVLQTWRNPKPAFHNFYKSNSFSLRPPEKRIFANRFPHSKQLPLWEILSHGDLWLKLILIDSYKKYQIDYMKGYDMRCVNAEDSRFFIIRIMWFEPMEYSIYRCGAGYINVIKSPHGAKFWMSIFYYKSE